MNNHRMPSDWMRLPYATDQGPAAGAAIGVLALASDITIESELREFLPARDMGVFVSRVPRGRASTLDNLRAMEPYITEATQRLLPDDHLDIIAFACTSGTAVIGAERIASLIREARPGIPVTDPLTAGGNGLKALGVKRIALLTPFQPLVNNVVCEIIVEGGFEIVVKGGFFCESGYEMSRISPRSIVESAVEIGKREDVDGVFIPCLAIRIANVIEEIEATLGKPVVSSAQAMAWEVLGSGRTNKNVPGRGRLLRSSTLEN